MFFLLLRGYFALILIEGREPEPHPSHESRGRQASVDLRIAAERLPGAYL
jgi:hypothetical protein